MTYSYKILCIGQKFISPSSGSWKVYDQGGGTFGVWRELASWFMDGHLPTVSSRDGRKPGSLCQN